MLDIKGKYTMNWYVYLCIKSESTKCNILLMTGLGFRNKNKPLHSQTPSNNVEIKEINFSPSILKAFVCFPLSLMASTKDIKVLEALEKYIL